jgi:two-component system response regulator FlrC
LPIAEASAPEAHVADGDDPARAVFTAPEEEPVMTLGELEKRAILRTLVATEGNRTKAADLLGISIRTLRNKLNEYRIEEGIAK